jgi:SAM-dependent methyltransferase
MSTLRELARSAVVHAAGTLPLVRPLLQQAARFRAHSPQYRDAFAHEGPTAGTPFTIFKDEWNSSVPGFATGNARLFTDGRVEWLESRLGSFAGRRVLELGPLEAGHTTMMERAGADVTAIEANQRAFLKCLIVKNALGLKSEFLYGDFRRYLEEAQGGVFDFVLAMGVLYHMLEPAKLLHDIARVTDAFGVWTHYYDANVIEPTPRFDRKPHYQSVDGKTVEVYRQNYLFSPAAPGFCGGTSPVSYWLTKAALLVYVASLGFDVEVGDEDPLDPRGPSILLFARRTGSAAICAAAHALASA